MDSYVGNGFESCLSFFVLAWLQQGLLRRQLREGLQEAVIRHVTKRAVSPDGSHVP